MSKAIFKDVLNSLKNTYNSIDIRAVCAKSKNEKGIWRIVFLKVRLTKETPQELKHIYNKKKENLTDINKPNFKIICESRKIEELDNFLGEIENMCIGLRDLHNVKPMKTNFQYIFDNQSVVDNTSLYTNTNEINGYRYLALHSKGARPIDVIRHCDVDLNGYGIDLSDLFSYLDVKSLTNDMDLIILLPIYCKRKDISYNNKIYLINYEIHKNLVENSLIILRIKKSGSLITKKEYEMESLVSSENELTICSLPITNEIDEHCDVDIEIRHKLINTLLIENFMGYEITSSSSKNTYDNMTDVMINNLDNSVIKEPKSIFIVHGHDENALYELSNLLKDEFKLETIILKNIAGSGRTIIEKFEEEAKKASFAFVLLTPDDTIQTVNGTYTQARPNVIFEMGWFYGYRGRDKVCMLLKEGTNIHSDLNGISQIRFSGKVKEVYLDIQRELKKAEIIT